MLAIHPRSNIVLLQAKRRSNFSGIYKGVTPEVGYRPLRDTLFIIMTDSSIQANTAYEYAFTGYDSFGNRINLNDTVFAKTFSQQTLNVPYHLKVYMIPGAEGNVLSWRLDDPSRIANISIYRSTSFDDGFIKIGDASPADTMVVDELTDPLVKYWYYLEMADITGETTFTSAKIFGRYETIYNPGPPVNITAESVENGVAVSWEAGTENIRGYHVYRSHAEGNFDLISNLLTDTFFVDKSDALNGNQTYKYAIQTENTSYLKSELLEPVFMVPGIETIPEAPTGIQINPNPDFIRIIWEPVNETDPSVRGYIVLRRSDDEEEWNELNQNPVLINSYSDSTIQHGKAYWYAVQAIDFRGNRSEISYTAWHHIPFQGKKIGPPTDLKVSTDGQRIELTWIADQRDGINGYKVYRKTYGQDYALIEIINNPTTGLYEDQDVSSNSLYMYQVTSGDTKVNESKRSKAIAIWF